MPKARGQILLRLAVELPIAQLRADYYRVDDLRVPKRQGILLSYALVVSLLLHVAGLLGWDHSDDSMDLHTPAAVEHSVSVRLLSPPVLSAEPMPVEAKPQPVVLSGAEPRHVQAELPRKLNKTPLTPRHSRKQTSVASVASQAIQETVFTEQVFAPSHAMSPEPDLHANLEQQRRRYLAKLFAHIEQFKFYPVVARRQGLQASVDVSFLLSADGNMQSIKIEGGPTLLRHAAQRSLQRAIPLPLPPVEQSLPMRIEYRMVFALH